MAQKKFHTVIVGGGLAGMLLAAILPAPEESGLLLEEGPSVLQGLRPEDLRLMLKSPEDLAEQYNAPQEKVLSILRRFDSTRIRVLLKEKGIEMVPAEPDPAEETLLKPLETDPNILREALIRAVKENGWEIRVGRRVSSIRPAAGSADSSSFRTSVSPAYPKESGEATEHVSRKENVRCLLMRPRWNLDADFTAHNVVIAAGEGAIAGFFPGKIRRSESALASADPDTLQLAEPPGLYAVGAALGVRGGDPMADLRFTAASSEVSAESIADLEPESVDREPPEPYHSEDAQELLAVAETYYENRDRLIYIGHGETFLNGGSVFDDELAGRGNIDCSTYLYLVLTGVPYEESPYAEAPKPRQLRRFSDRGLETGNAGKPVTTAAGLARYYFDRGRCFLDPDAARPGDIVFFRSERYASYYIRHGRFLAISHVGILAGGGRMLNARGYVNKEVNLEKGRDAVDKTPLSGRNAPPILYARPIYGKRKK
ncbi:MAG: hypothetical protein ACOYJJ_02940 [Anaerovoracaceae bacterium]|jgi:hypothetical protein